jgi:hypothetical protein
MRPLIYTLIAAFTAASWWLLLARPVWFVGVAVGMWVGTWAVGMVREWRERVVLPRARVIR